MNFSFLPGSSRGSSKVKPDRDPAVARLMVHMRANGPRLERHHKQVVAQLLVAVFLVAALVFARQYLSGEAKLILTVQGQQRIFEGRVASGMTVLDALNASVIAGGINMRFSVDRRGDKALVWMLDGYEGRTSPISLQVSLNDRSVNSVQIHETPVGSGDTIAVRVISR